jgi:hypothetical protein
MAALLRGSGSYPKTWRLNLGVVNALPGTIDALSLSHRESNHRDSMLNHGDSTWAVQAHPRDVEA